MSTKIVIAGWLRSSHGRNSILFEVVCGYPYNQIMDNHKKCLRCGEYKDRTEFYKLKSLSYKPEWDCRASHCKTCQIAARSEQRREVKRKAVEYKGGKCVDCKQDFKSLAVYEFHHLDPDEKDFSLGSNNCNKFDDSIRLELDKCVLLCANCHRIRHNPE